MCVRVRVFCSRRHHSVSSPASRRSLSSLSARRERWWRVTPGCASPCPHNWPWWRQKTARLWPDSANHRSLVKALAYQLSFIWHYRVVFCPPSSLLVSRLCSCCPRPAFIVSSEDRCWTRSVPVSLFFTGEAPPASWCSSGLAARKSPGPQTTNL